jgi:hypothetical protein
MRQHQKSTRIDPADALYQTFFALRKIKEKKEECAKTTTAGISFSAWEIITLLLLPCHESRLLKILH